VTHDLEVLEATDYVVFDSWLLDIIQCEDLELGSAKKMMEQGAEDVEVLGNDLQFEIDVVNPLIGDALTVHLNRTY
jgi:hypothetical protein